MLVIAGTRAPEEEEDDECSQLSILGFASASQVKEHLQACHGQDWQIKRW